MIKQSMCGLQWQDKRDVEQRHFQRRVAKRAYRQEMGIEIGKGSAWICGEILSSSSNVLTDAVRPVTKTLVRWPIRAKKKLPKLTGKRKMLLHSRRDVAESSKTQTENSNLLRWSGVVAAGC